MKKFLLCLTALSLFMALGCNKDTQTETAASASETKKNTPKLDTIKLDLSSMDCEKIDINEDGKIDQKIYSKNGVTQCVVRDLNFDGVTDMTEFYRDGIHYRDEIDLDFDEICDLIVTYENGVAVKKEYSYDFDSNRHGIQFFDSNGNRTEVRRDNDGDGKYDTIEHYRPGEDEPYRVDSTLKAEKSETDKNIKTDNNNENSDNTVSPESQGTNETAK